MTTPILERSETGPAGTLQSAAAGGEPHAVDCRTCWLTGDVLASAAEAVLLAGVHDRLRHGGRPTAAAFPVSVPCRSCQAAPAVLPAPTATAPRDRPDRPDGPDGAVTVCSACFATSALDGTRR